MTNRGVPPYVHSEETGKKTKTFGRKLNNHRVWSTCGEWNSYLLITCLILLLVV